ncbi:MAG: hypothetical protein K0Q74_280 [Gammaproteobacteria bacterium]|jgi:enamine deaminase RidA (YjgF/YER057c/UK114 family)|nr:hypothetical protein [Gammaproteobacteria bacterium]
MQKRLIQFLLLLIMLFSSSVFASTADKVIRHRIPNSDFPILEAVEVPAGLPIVYLSGQVPTVQDASKPKDSPLAYGGDTKGQTIAVLKSIEKILEKHGLCMGDVIKMQVFLVADPAKGNRMDFDGFMEGYRQFFGAPGKPRFPVRSTFQVAGLVNPAWFVEIEVVAVKQ